MEAPTGFLSIQEAFKIVGPLILENAGRVSDHDTKADGTPVTEIDRQVESKIFEFVLNKHPDLKIFGEETGYSEDNLDQPCWLIDPIDGTSSFIKNIPAFTSMAVFIENNEAIASIIYNPSTGDLYSTVKGMGTRKNGNLINLSDTDMPKIAHCKQRYSESLNKLLLDKDIDCRTGESGIGKDIALLLDGEIAARFSLPGGGYIHDYAGGFLMIQEAGGTVIPVIDDELSYKTRSFVSCHPALTDTLRQHRIDLADLQSKLG